MSTAGIEFVPAIGVDLLLPFYDLFTKLLGADTAHRHLLEQAQIAPDHRILEIGCGTDNLALLAKQINPTAQVLGIDPDAKALVRTQRKSARAGQPLWLHQAFSELLPFCDAAFDRVLSAFMLHHVQPAAKAATMREVYRVLKPGGSVHIVDFEGDQRCHGCHRRAGHLLHQEIPQLLHEPGLADVAEVGQEASAIGKIAYYSAVRPAIGVASTV